MEAFLHDNSLFLVLGIAIILWLGIALYLFMIDGKISNIEKQLEDKIDIKSNGNSHI